MWPSENPWPVIIACLIVAIAMLIVWSQRKSGWLLVLVIVPVLVAAGAWTFDQMVVTEREKVTEDVRGIVAAFQSRNLDQTLSYISESARDLKLLAASAYNLVKLGPDTRVTDIQVTMLPRNERAVTVFRVNSTAQASGGASRLNTMWEARWQPENGEWKMIDIIPCDAMTGKREPIPSEWRRALNVMYPQSP
ncbi:hypothetical protein SH661x_000343 [Planctomicrobium sp. SH661]|uniref:hypothetical protein n=1 Tax=Planctomicrobium sp. SH661 TaxID=3448124 RepID=UPI003F5B00F3